MYIPRDKGNIYSLTKTASCMFIMWFIQQNRPPSCQHIFCPTHIFQRCYVAWIPMVKQHPSSCPRTSLTIDVAPSPLRYKGHMIRNKENKEIEQPVQFSYAQQILKPRIVCWNVVLIKQNIIFRFSWVFGLDRLC